MKILVTGGIGYIGSHTVVELLNEGYEVVVIDNLYNSKIEVVDKIKEITGKDFTFYKGDVCDKEILEEIFTNHKIDATIHFAGFKAVGESVEQPLKYYQNNIVSTLSLCETMSKYNVKNIVFSSSATVYGLPENLPIEEAFEIRHATNPYGETKIVNEKILNDLHISDTDWNVALLRYFNPIGAHKSGLIGENPNDIPNNLMPYIVKVATGEYKELSVYGNDYDTVDGTGVRDYIHVVDLAKAHIKAIEWTFKNKGIDAFNIGTGHGYSVLELVEAFKKYNNVDVPYKIAPRRKGDIASCYADASYAKKELGWESQLEIEDMVKDSYNFAIKQRELQ